MIRSDLHAALSALSITGVWAALGGGPLRHGRGKAFWRGGDGFTVAIANGRGWYDHRDNRGGGALELVRVALGCETRDALAWLRENSGLRYQSAPVDRARYLNARTQADVYAAWHQAELVRLTELRNFHLSMFHTGVQLILRHGLDHPDAAAWVTGSEQSETAYLALDAALDSHRSDAGTEASIRRWRTNGGAR